MGARAAPGTSGSPGPRAAPGSAALWYGLLGAPAAWSLQEVLSYALVSIPCGADAATLGADSGAGLPIAAIAVSAAALLVSVGALATAIRSWRAAPSAEGGATVLERATRDRIAFMAFSGIFVSAVFTIGIAFAAAGPLALAPCG